LRAYGAVMKSIALVPRLFFFLFLNSSLTAAAQQCTGSGDCEYPLPAASCPLSERVQHGPPTSNGCGPEGGILHRILPQFYGTAPLVNACNTHDICYGSCGSGYDKATCDNNFFRNLLSVCANAYPGFSNVNKRNGCYNLGNVYFNAVKDGGQKAYDAAQFEFCECCTSTCSSDCMFCPGNGCIPNDWVCCGPGNPTGGYSLCGPAPHFICCTHSNGYIYCDADTCPSSLLGPITPRVRAKSGPATPEHLPPAATNSGSSRSLSVTVAQPGSPGTWNGFITSPDADALGVQFMLGEQDGALSGRMFLADPETGALVELDGVTGSRTGDSATWTTASGVLVTGRFDFTKAQFSGTLQFPLYEGTAPLVAQLNLRSSLSRCPLPEQPCASGCCQPQCGPHFVPCATGCCPEPP
jgi:hypothetical protein